MATWMLERVANTPRLVIGGLVLCLLYYLGLHVTNYRARRKLILQHGCKPPARFPVWDRLLGLDNMYTAIRAAQRKTFLSEKRSDFDRYGNTYSSRLTTYPVIVTIEPENIRTILSSSFKDVTIGSPRKTAFAPVVTRSVLVLDGIEWEHSRAFLKPSFTRSQVGDLATLEVHTHNLIEAIPRDGSTVDLAELFLRYTADVTTDFMFGESILSLPQPEAFGGDLVKAFRDATLAAERRFRLGDFANFVPQPALYRCVKKIHAYMETYVDKAMKERAAQKERPENQASDTGRYIFLQELAKLTDDRLTVRDELLGIFFAGRDTTAALLSNLFFVLARDARAWKRLREEIGSLGGRKPTLEELKGIKYLSYCLNESQKFEITR